MKKTSKDISTVCGTADGRKTKKQGTVSGILERVKLFFVGDGGKPIDNGGKYFLPLSQKSQNKLHF